MQEAFAKYVDVNSVAESLAAPKAARLTPKAFMHSITQKCQADPQHIVLPEVSTAHFTFLLSVGRMFLMWSSRHVRLLLFEWSFVDAMHGLQVPARISDVKSQL